jgi:hypothetical protein
MIRYLKWGITSAFALIVLGLGAAFTALITVNVENYAQKEGLDKLYEKPDVFMGAINTLLEQTWPWTIFWCFATATAVIWLYDFYKKREEPVEKKRGRGLEHIQKVVKEAQDAISDGQDKAYDRMQEREKAESLGPQRMPFLEFLSKAEGLGWVFKGNSHDILDICKEVRQAASDGIFILFGQLNTSGPILKIPEDHWQNFEIDPIQCMNWDNSGITSMRGDNNNARTKDVLHNQGYTNLHVETNPAMGWLEKQSRSKTGGAAEYIPLSEVARKAYDKHKNPDDEYDLDFVSFIDTGDDVTGADDVLGNIAKAIAHYVEIFGVNKKGKDRIRINIRDLSLRDNRDYFGNDGNSLYRQIYGKNPAPPDQLIWKDICVRKSDEEKALNSILGFRE